MPEHPLTDEERAAMVTAAKARDRGARPHPVDARVHYAEGFQDGIAYVREQEPSDAIKALEKIEARAGDRPPYSQMALDMWTIARAALKAARER